MMFSYACDSAIDVAEVVKQKDCHSTTIYFYSVYFFYFHVHVCLLSSLSTHFVSSFFPIYFRAWLPKSGTAVAAPAVPLATRLMIDSVLAIPVMTDMTSAHFLTTQSVFYAIN